MHESLAPVMAAAIAVGCLFLFVGTLTVVLSGGRLREPPSERADPFVRGQVRMNRAMAPVLLVAGPVLVLIGIAGLLLHW